MGRTLKAAGLAALVVAAIACQSPSNAPAPSPRSRVGERAALQQRLQRGWNTWDSRSVLRQVLLPEAFAINLAFKQRRWIEEPYLATALIGRRGPDAERIRPGAHRIDGSYTSLEIRWQQLQARVESGHDGDDLVVLVTPLSPPAAPVTVVVESAMLWNRSGTLSGRGAELQAVLPARSVTVHVTGEPVDDPFVPTTTPYVAVALDTAVGVATGRARSVAEIRDVLARRAAERPEPVSGPRALDEAATALEAGLAWNTVYEPRHDRVIATVGRLWNEEYGGYALFGWDNFFLSYAATLISRDLAAGTLLEHLDGATEEGFIPNDNAGNGRRSWDRSQPPVGALMARGLHRRLGERWIIEAAFDPLLRWNRWWPARRLNDGLLAYGSHAAPNPLDEPDRETMVTAGYESGMDDSPMYEGVPFDRRTSTMALQDVGLTSLYIADCEALAGLADELGREAEAHELRERAGRFRQALERLWDERTGLYLNRRTDTGDLMTRLSPVHFYPLLARAPSPGRADRMVREHLLNPAEFWGEHVVPSIARTDPAFPRQRYWRGAIWPPLNFLVYLALREYDMPAARRALADKSLQLFLREWRRQGFVSENYSALTGTGDDERLSSDRFHAWGVLFALPAFIEAGVLPAP